MESTVRIKDISLVAYLFATGKVTLLERQRNSKGDIYFIFSQKDKVDELIAQYWNLQAPVIQPKQLFSAMRDVKDMLFSV